ncbi:SGNH/GDSL hydrolase family protein [Nocardia sp. CDC159]|uniref:SGNH/GDSL hydrolase family protein n=1 Tax=Nocardia pulmonis TaxID=2951408 RepID=A0A9X2IXC9_9NOCA|nr:SGNH/GDSL hydrolase family protein [Nocardia pulmonis]MCM6786597.1 SGNH/GDSL hydrolase family protein [Nocardia sp. CDC159]
MSSDKPSSRNEEPRQVSDELLRKASEGPVRQLPDALFGGPADDRGGAVSDELLRKASEGPVRQLPDVLSGESASEPAAPRPETGGGDDASGDGGSTGPPGSEPDFSHIDATVGRDTAGSDETPSTAEAEPTRAEGSAHDDGASVVVPAAAAPDAQVDPATSGPDSRPVLLVIADSLAYFGPKGGLPADDPRIWPNLVAAELDWDVELVARIGWTCRDAYWALIGDPRVWAAVPRAGAVVFATGGMDSLPSPLPTALRELIRYLRPPAVRRRVRASYGWLQPRLSKLGRPVALPPRVSVDYLEQSRNALAQLRPELPVVAVLPSVHDCAAYGRVHSGREPAVRALRAWSATTGVPLVDLGDAVRDNIFSGEANPDGIHWGWEGHTAVARAMVKVLSEVRAGGDATTVVR